VRIWKSLAVAGVVTATATALAVAPAMADPVNLKYHSVTPNAWDIVSAGSNTTQYLEDQLAYNYDAALAGKHVKSTPSTPYFYSWDAVNPKAPQSTTPETVQLKAGKTCKNVRPTSSGSGIADMTTYGDTTYKYKVKGKTKTFSAPCINFARSSRGRKATDPPLGPNGDAFVIFAQDAVTYAGNSGGNVPSDLTPAQLTDIFSCDDTAGNGYPGGTWGSIGADLSDPTAAAQDFDPIIYELSSGTESFWETALGVTFTGALSCSTEDVTGVVLPEENEGTSQYFYKDNTVADGPNPNAITLFSIGSWIDQAVHSPLCGKKASKTQNKFGCDAVGHLVLGGISGHAATVVVKHVTVINSAFPATFKRFLYNVVPYAPGTSNHIPSNLEALLSSGSGKHPGFFCSKGQQATIEQYGFLPVGKACSSVV